MTYPKSGDGSGRPLGAGTPFKVFGGGAVGAESELVTSAVKRLDEIIASTSDGPSIVAVEALTRHTARRVIDGWLSRHSGQKALVVRLQPWRSSGEANDIRILLSAQLVNECRAEGVRGSSGRDPSELYRWLSSGSWSPVMQAELDRIVKDWLHRLPEERFFVLIEGLEECRRSAQKLVHKLIATLLRDHRALTLLDSQVSSGMHRAWEIDASLEVPTFGPSEFQSWVGHLLVESGIVQQADLEPSRDRWARLIRDASYPDASKAKQLVNDMALSAHKATTALREAGGRSLRESAPLGLLTEPGSSLAKICFMSVLTCRFPKLAKSLQTDADGVDGLIRLVLWSRRSQGETQEAAEQLATNVYGRLNSEKWLELVRDPSVARFLRDVFWREPPLIQLFDSGDPLPQSRRGAMASYFWAGRRGLVSTATKLSRPAETSFSWWLIRHLIPREWQSQTQEAPSVENHGNRNLVSEVLSADDWELMSACALEMVKHGLINDPQEKRWADDALLLAKTAVERVRRAGDGAGELRARGALAEVFASVGSTQLADSELALAAAIPGLDELDRTRLREFRAMVRLRDERDENEKAQPIKASPLIDATLAALRVGLDDVAERTATELINLRPTPPPAESGPLKVFLSYRSADAYAAEPVRKMLDELDNPAIQVFHDKRLTGGVDWWNKIVTELRSAHVAVVLLTNAYATNSISTEGDDYCYLEQNEIRFKQRSERERFWPLIADVEGVELPARDWAREFSTAQFIWGKNRPRGQTPNEKEIGELCIALSKALIDLSEKRSAEQRAKK